MDTNYLYYGDNLDVLRRYVKDDSVDLIYLDPPFNSNQDYNVLFAEQDGSRSASQIKAFGDTWRWDTGPAKAWQETVEQGGKVSQVMQAFRTLLGDNNMLAYLSMMAPRLVELRRVLKPTGSIYLHCDPTASAHLRLLMDAVFGPEQFRNEIIWKRSDAKGDIGQGAKHFGRVNDVLLFYGKTAASILNAQYGPLNPDYVNQFYRYKDPDGRRYKLDNMLGPGGAAKGNPSYEVMGVTRYWRYTRKRMEELIKAGRVIQTKPGTVPMYKRYLDESKGTPLTSNWSDISLLRGWSGERLGYPTQKPEALLDRIINASSKEGDVVLDPFCGCGTAIAVAQRLHRQWIGIDITRLAITLIKHRLHDAYGDKAVYKVIGEPVSLPDAEALAKEDPYGFQFWALGLVGARPVDEKKGADKGVDGRLYFHDEAVGRKTKQVVFSVKAGHVNVSFLRDLRGVMERDKAEIGVFISMEEATQPMRVEAAGAGFYHSPGWNTDYPRVQLLTIADLLGGKGIAMPPIGQVNVTFKRAPKARTLAVDTLPMALDDDTKIGSEETE